MSEIRILIPIHVLPTTKNVITIFFQNFLHHIKNRSKIHLIWLVYMPERISTINDKTTDESIIDIHNYKDAYDVIKKEKPDLIYASPDWAFVDFALSSAAKYYKIPVFFMVPNINTKFFKRKNIKSIILNSMRFFENSIPTDTDINERQFLRRGRFFLKKYLFLIKTQIKLKNDIFLSLFIIWKYVLTGVTSNIFASDTIQFLENESMKQYMLERGFNESNLHVSGNPMYDLFFEKDHNHKLNIKNPKILFIPSTAYEHGYWTIQQRDFSVKQIVKQISEQNNLKLLIKIHPSSSILSDYSSIVDKIDDNIPIYQKGSIDKYLKDIDVVVTSPFSSSAEIYALLAHKRIVICNFFEESSKDQLVEHGVAVSCKTPDSLIDSIQKALELESFDQQREDFINNFLYKWDGNSSKRITDKLFNIIKQLS
jgi:hypothetical protein